MAGVRTFRVTRRDRDLYRLRVGRGVTEAFEVTRSHLRIAVMASTPGQYDPEELWSDEWWVQAVNDHIAPALWSVYWSAAAEAGQAVGYSGPTAGTYARVEQRWRTQVMALYGYAETVGRRVLELSAQGQGETRGWMLDKLGLVAAAGPLSDGIGGGMEFTESLSAENGGVDSALSGDGIKTWLQTGPRPRPTHVDADGQETDIDGVFVVGGFEGEYPGDAALPPQERCNCECSVEYQVDTGGEYSFGEVEPVVDPFTEALDGFDGLPENLTPDLLPEGVTGPETQPASARLDTKLRSKRQGPYRARGIEGLQQTVDEVVAAIDEIHALPMDVNDVEFHVLGKADSKEGAFQWFEDNPEAKTFIGVKDTADAADTVAHELGHYFDYTDLGTEKGTFGTGKFSFSRDGVKLFGYSEEMAPFIEAVQQSPEFQQLVQMLTDGMAGQGTQVGGVFLDANRVTRFTQYLLDPQELWARAYSQFVAVESGNAAMLADMMQMGLYPTQWAPEAFEPVRDAIRQVLRNAGVMA